LDNQINELSKGHKANNSPNKYNLRSNKKEGNLDAPKQPRREEKPTKDITDIKKGKKVQEPSPVIKVPIP
jgi:hypothetical protein